MVECFPDLFWLFHCWLIMPQNSFRIEVRSRLCLSTKSITFKICDILFLCENLLQTLDSTHNHWAFLACEDTQVSCSSVVSSQHACGWLGFLNCSALQTTWKPEILPLPLVQRLLIARGMRSLSRLFTVIKLSWLLIYKALNKRGVVTWTNKERRGGWSYRERRK